MSASLYSNGAIQAAAATANNIRNRQNDYRASITQNEEFATNFAACIMLEVPTVLESLDDDAMKAEFLAFVEEQKKRLVKVAETNVKHQREVTCFCDGLKNVQQQLLQQTQQPDQKEQDYERVLNTEIQVARDHQMTLNLEINQEESVREMQTALGIATATGAAAAAGNESDDELEVVPTTSVHALKCPIGRGIFVNPHKCKVCKHVYSLENVQQLVAQARGRNLSCPVSGCSNTHLTLDSCEPDRLMAMQVKRHLRNEAHQNQIRMSQAVDLEDEDE
mmetsp:Transcript_30404/g.50169  ORF Transcript_30404/g.50169 Transcript_30404/m.50169 type:complete len:278 (+) Transcript_30404:68-901(+)|eukprot:CAMPEP_0119014134 /NCGR_PEP_ID=MMETSP1176-20130426/9373_1 /TAXON_ID=265551 /ORGANISM="Synedropsis recta cf, Strain CCMP1620" /LENGTH=277 /DNA_ID=CAMNT_0006967275 /DNA_START=64 /DNA_END=897 /DNA_ORIENTATION=-